MTASSANTRIFQCFKAGTHTTMHGVKMVFTEADLQAHRGKLSAAIGRRNRPPGAGPSDHRRPGLWAG
jgi:hypothetical protein